MSRGRAREDENRSRTRRPAPDEHGSVSIAPRRVERAPSGVARERRRRRARTKTGGSLGDEKTAPPCRRWRVIHPEYVEPEGLLTPESIAYQYRPITSKVATARDHETCAPGVDALRRTTPTAQDDDPRRLRRHRASRPRAREVRDPRAISRATPRAPPRVPALTALPSISPKPPSQAPPRLGRVPGPPPAPPPRSSARRRTPTSPRRRTRRTPPRRASGTPSPSSRTRVSRARRATRSIPSPAPKP